MSPRLDCILSKFFDINNKFHNLMKEEANLGRVRRWVDSVENEKWYPCSSRGEGWKRGW